MNNSESLVLSTMTSDAFVMVNKQLVRYFKGDASSATFLSELISAYKYHVNNQTVEPDGAFAIPIKRYQIILGFTAAKQDRMLKLFVKTGLAFTRLQGFPAVKYVAVNWDNVAAILANNDMERRQTEKKEFYSNLNEAINSTELNRKSIMAVESACDNMADVLKGTLILISRDYKNKGFEVPWTSVLVGKVRYWGYKRSLGKVFDYSIITRTIATMKHLPGMTFEKYLNDFIKTARGIQDVHYQQQKTSYQELLD